MVEWDDSKDDENVRKHHIPLRYAELIFEGPFVEEEDDRRDYGETRFKAVGPIADFKHRIFVAVYTWRDTNRRIISLRKANEREIRKYQANVA
ncbi:MAG: BrnT family toxin [Sphingomicrobium sp.]